MKRAILLAAGLGLAALYACGDDATSGASPEDAGALPSPTATATAAPTGDAAPPVGPRTSCSDRPGLPRPPADGRLPCELIPPGLSL